MLHFVREATGWSDAAVFALCIWLSHNVCYYGYGFFLEVAYRRNLWPQWKIAPDKYPTQKFGDGFFGQLALRLTVQPLVWAAWYTYVLVPCGMSLDAPLGSPLQCSVLLLLSFYGFFAFNCVVHMASHKFPFLYRFHKTHHEYKITTAWAAEHFDIYLVDNIMNTIPTLVPPLLLGFHPLLWCLHMVFRTVESLDTHSGYEIPFTPFRFLPGFAEQQRYHSFHHSHNVGTYSNLLFDHLTGADAPYLKFRKASFWGLLLSPYRCLT